MTKEEIKTISQAREEEEERYRLAQAQRKEEARLQNIARADRDQATREVGLFLADLCGGIDPFQPILDYVVDLQEQIDKLQEEVNELKEKKVIIKHHVHQPITVGKGKRHDNL